PVAVLDSKDHLRPARPFGHGPLRSRRRTPAETRRELAALAADARGPAKILAVPVAGALRRCDVETLAARAEGPALLLWLVLVGHGRRRDLPAEGLFRAVQATCAELTARGLPGVVVPVALPDPAARELEAVAAAYGAHALLGPDSDPDPEPDSAGPWHPAGPWHSAGPWHPAFAVELERCCPPPPRRGVTVFLTGLSGSGKSTIARGLTERLRLDGARTVSLLDGDEIRRLLSAGLGFDRRDRDLNILRIGYVASEITRHGGLAICAPIAPFERTRRQVREMVDQVGDFLLVHVSTPLAECERRDRKGLYARAREGLLGDFTGISSPYEEPPDADLTVDTTDLSVDEGIDRIQGLLLARGHLPARRPPSR
ncbi:MAG: sulfate adenylyltransferase, partial [Actinomycetota bacterium]|nr:sulfate adenylyltransferase [Actinomycetota bacterium]